MPYRISKNFNGRCVWREEPGVQHCSGCGRPVQAPDQTYHCRGRLSRNAPLTISRDGIYVASRAFIIAYDKARLRGLDFQIMENNYFAVRVARRVSYDLERSPILQENWCSLCQRWETELVRFRELHLAEGESVAPDEFVVSVHEFGGAEIAGPQMIVGDEVIAHMAHFFNGHHRLGVPVTDD